VQTQNQDRDPINDRRLSYRHFAKNILNFHKYTLAEVKIPEVKDKSEHDDEKKTKKLKLWPFG
jgi:type VI protein secretion system component Hcp